MCFHNGQMIYEKQYMSFMLILILIYISLHSLTLAKHWEHYDNIVLKNYL